MIRAILTHYLKTVSEDVLRQKFQKAEAGIVVGMRSKGLTPETASLQVLVRDALFRLFRSVIHSGDVADLCRDFMDDEVIREVMRTLTAEDLLNLPKIVRATGEAAIGVMF